MGQSKAFILLWISLPLLLIVRVQCLNVFSSLYQDKDIWNENLEALQC